MEFSATPINGHRTPTPTPECAGGLSGREAAAQRPTRHLFGGGRSEHLLVPFTSRSLPCALAPPLCPAPCSSPPGLPVLSSQPLPSTLRPSFSLPSGLPSVPFHLPLWGPFRGPRVPQPCWCLRVGKGRAARLLCRLQGPRPPGAPAWSSYPRFGQTPAVLVAAGDDDASPLAAALGA